MENENGGKTTEQFSSGEVAWLLNGDQTNLIWKQNLDNGEAKDNYPVLNGGDVYKVNKYATCNQSDTPVSAYSNTNADISGTHSLIKHDGISATCTALGSLEYWHCETCGKNFADEAGQQEPTIGTEIAALGHEIVKTDARRAYRNGTGKYCLLVLPALRKIFSGRGADTGNYEGTDYSCINRRDDTFCSTGRTNKQKIIRMIVLRQAIIQILYFCLQLC